MTQIIGFGLANLIGLAIVLLSIQSYWDIDNLFNSEDGFLSNNFIIVNKKVSLLKTLRNKRTYFTEDEIADVANQPFVKRSSVFLPASYQVKAFVRTGKNFPAFYTDLFFESVPDEFLDVQDAKWQWEEGDELIPVIIPRSYLALYNFGFAPSQGLPQVSENIIKQVGLKVRIVGGGKERIFDSRIVGFSDRLNTILVPYDFMSWANKNYGSGETIESARMIIETENPADPSIAKYFTDENYELNNDALETGKLSYFLRLAVFGILTIGLIISALAIGLLILSINLLIEKNKDKLKNLHLIGYEVKTIARPYQLLAISLNLSCLIIAAIIVVIVRGSLLEQVSTLYPGFDPGSSGIILISFVIIVMIAALNWLWIKRRVVKTIV